jgi:Transglycosylase
VWAGVGVLTVGLVLVIAIVTAPRWAAGRIESELEQRVGDRLDADVEIGELQASWSGAELRDVVVSSDGAKIAIDTIDVAIDRRELWSGRVQVVEIEAVGGHLDGTRVGLESLARKLLELKIEPDSDRDRSWLRRRTRLTPDALELRQLDFAVRDEGRRATGSLAATVEPEQRRVELRVTTLVAELGLGRPLRAASVRTTLEQRDGQLRFPLTVDVAGVATEIDENIAVAGVHGSVTAHDHEAADISVELAGGFAEAQASGASLAGGDLWSVSGRFARDLSTGKLAVDMQAFELGRVPDVLARLPVVESDHATIAGHLEIDFGGGVAKVDGQLAVAGLNVSHELLAREVVRDVGFEIDIDAKIDPAARRLEIERLAVQRAGVELLAHGELVHTAAREQRRYRVQMEIPSVGCQQVLDAIPRELVPGLAGFELDGRFSAHMNIDADFANLDALVLAADIGLDDCRVRAAPRHASPEYLNGGFVQRVTMRDGRTARVGLYGGSSSYTSLANMSRYMTEAVLTTEDGSFRRHDGFNHTQLEVALRRNLQSGKVRLGASTITMQMVKNVLLSHERTLSRKLQELFLTWWVEQALSKQRIMELYLNVIEFGPGVYGVTNASRHYFGKHPSELTSLEAAMLATMLPSPVRRHVHYCNGALDERFEAKVRNVHKLMFERGRITAEEHDVYAAVGLQFDLLERGDPQQCLIEIETLMAGTQTQRALSGLLGERDDMRDDDVLDWAHRSVGPPGESWGIWPPLPGLEGLGDLGDLAVSEPGMRLEPHEAVPPGVHEAEGIHEVEDDSWRGSPDPVDGDPSNSDAPGQPAMDEVERDAR